MLLLCCCFSLAHSIWATRMAYRSDFFCSTIPESYESWLLDDDDGQSSCLFYPSSNGTASWRMAQLSRSILTNTSAVTLQQYSDANCSSFVSVMWSETELQCRAVGPVADNLFTKLELSNGAPVFQKVIEKQYFNSTSCGENVQLIEGMSLCTQVQLRVGVVWIKTKCDLKLNSFRQQFCVVADCNSGCSEPEPAIPLFQCAADGGSSFRLGRCDSPAVDPAPPNPGLPGILPPLNGACQLRAALGFGLVVAAAMSLL